MVKIDEAQQQNTAFVKLLVLQKILITIGNFACQFHSKRIGFRWFNLCGEENDIANECVVMHEAKDLI